LIHYHGTDGMDAKSLVTIMSNRHAMVSFAMPSTLPHVADICSTFALDNGAFSTWRQGKQYDFEGFKNWVEQWQTHPAYHWHLIPDVIDGTEQQNSKLVEQWQLDGVPVWHMNESIEYLADLCKSFRMVAIGSSGAYAYVGTQRWWGRISEAMDAICVDGKPVCKLHGLRQLQISIFTKLPFHSADSTNMVRGTKFDKLWKGYNSPKSKHVRGLVIADRIEAHQSAPRWKPMAQQLSLF